MLSLYRFLVILFVAAIASVTFAVKSTNVDVDYEIIGNKLDERDVNLREFNQKFVQFLRSKHIDEQPFFESMLSDDAIFNRHIKDFLKSFKESKAKDFKEGLMKQISIILFNDYGYEPLEAKIVGNFILNSDRVSSPDLVYDIEKLKLQIAPLVATYKRTSAFKKLRKTLNNWFLTLIEVNEHYVDYLMAKDVEVATIDEIGINKSNFRLFAKSHFDEFYSKNENLIFATMLDQVQEVLNSEYQKQDTRHRSIIKTMDEDKLIDRVDAYLLYDRFELKKQVMPIIDSIIQKQYLNEAYHDLEANLNVWIPNTLGFAKKFSKFSRDEGTDWSQVKTMSEDKQNFFSDDNKALLSFIDKRKADYDALVREQVEKVLRSIDASDVQNNFKKLKNVRFERRITLEMLGDSNALKHFLKTELAKTG